MKSTKDNITELVSELGTGPKGMIDYIENNPDELDYFVKFSMTNEKNAWRAAWAIDHFSRKNPEKFEKYSDAYIKALQEIEADGHIREILRILINLNLNEEQICEVHDICCELIQNNKRQSSVRAIAFQFIIKVAKQYPELQEEIRIIFDNIKEYMSPGIRNSVKYKLDNNLKNKIC